MTPPRRTVRSIAIALMPRSAAIAVAAALLLVAALAVPASALAITRDTVLARAQKWVDSPVPYSQSKSFGGYRADCSGYVSMAWQTGFAYDTASMRTVATKLTADQLKPGDVMLRAKTASRTGHVRLFYAWVDETRTTYIAYEQTGPSTKSSVKSIANDLNDGYLPYRYNKIADSPAPWSVTANPLFDVWADGDPAWWVFGSSGGGLTGHQVRSDSVASKAFALGLSNLSPSAATYIDARQSVPVEPGKTYVLQTYASTTASPSSVKLRIQLYSAGGLIVLDRSTTGDSWDVGAAHRDRWRYPWWCPPASRGRWRPCASRALPTPLGSRAGRHPSTTSRCTSPRPSRSTGSTTARTEATSTRPPVPSVMWWRTRSPRSTPTRDRRTACLKRRQRQRPLPVLQPQEGHALLHRLDR